MSFSGNLDGIRVDHNALDTAVVGMQKIAGDIDRTLDDLISDLRPLVDQWDGETKRAFHEMERVWDQSMREMRGILDRSAQSVDQSNSDFRAVDLKNAANFNF